MKKFLMTFLAVSLVSLTLAAPAAAQSPPTVSVTFAWQQDYTPILGGWNLYYQAAAGAWQPFPPAFPNFPFLSRTADDQYTGTVQLAVPEAGTPPVKYTFRLNARDVQGVEAAPSNTAEYTVNPPACAYAINPTAASVEAAGGSQSLAVLTTAKCPWTAASSVDWISVIPPAGGTGNGTVAYTVQPNAAFAARTGILTVAGQTLTITQSAAAPPPLGPPKNFRIALLSNKVVLLRWDPPDQNREMVDGYIVHYGMAPANYTDQVDVGKNMEALLEKLKNNRRYYSSVRTYDTLGRSSPASNEINFKP